MQARTQNFSLVIGVVVGLGVGGGRVIISHICLCFWKETIQEK